MKAKFRVGLKERPNESFAFSGGSRFAHRALRLAMRADEVGAIKMVGNTKRLNES
tara:strand:- start:490 stop:654 length:165 start_codon:yes stop_codon:yes gene_type:complete